MRILIVEDDLEAAEAMARGLTEASHVCVRGADGQEGLEAAQGGGFDVMIVDRMMPRMNGVELVETLRREGDRTPVLFLSALGEVSDRVDGLQAGADDYLVKPYAFAELIARWRPPPISPPLSTPPRRPGASAFWSASIAMAAPPSCRSRFRVKLRALRGL